MERVLIVEDDRTSSLLLSSYLEKQGYQTTVLDSGEHAVSSILSTQPDAVILDGNLPVADGFTICREVRGAYHGVILMLTGRDDDLDQVLGLELGADGYLVKPTPPRLVEANLKACLRRTRARAPKTQRDLRFGKFRISRAERLVEIAGEEITLTTAEFELLWLLAEHAGQIVSRDDIMRTLRNIPHDGLDRSIDMRVSRIRKRLHDDNAQPRRIKTVRGMGYIFSPSEWD